MTLIQKTPPRGIGQDVRNFVRVARCRPARLSQSPATHQMAIESISQGEIASGGASGDLDRDTVAEDRLVSGLFDCAHGKALKDGCGRAQCHDVVRLPRCRHGELHDDPTGSNATANRLLRIDGDYSFPDDEWRPSAIVGL